jgi:tRNA-Thr(GGU) m(6)t(6)A37 methyltransferase TsaA
MTQTDSDIRPGETAVETPAEADAGLWFVGRIRTPWQTRDACPRQGDAEAGPVCRLEIAPRWQAALEGMEEVRRAQVLYWMHAARRDLVRQSPRSHGGHRGTFALRSPVRPNPVAVSEVAVLGVEDGTVLVRGLDCLDGTPLIDLKPIRCSASM